MAKDKEKKLAEHLYIEKGLTAKEVSLKVGVTESTISAWVNKWGWKARREALATSAASRYNNLQEVVSSIAAERLSLSRELDTALRIGDEPTAATIRMKMAKLDDGAAKWNKVLTTAKTEAHVPLSTYMDVMDRIFNALRAHDEKLYLQTIQFQEHHLTEISSR